MKRFTVWFTGLTMGMMVVLQPALSQTQRYVALTSATPMPGYTSWATAATNIQDAIDASDAGDTVWVTNGVYAVGGRIDYPTGTFLTNRVVINKAITVRSANNDPANTIIQGAWDPATNGSAAVRCVYMSAGSLIGFTVTNGATWHTSGTIYGSPYAGGGVHCVDNTPVISNCVITGNAAQYQGGGVLRGKLVGCTMRGNWVALQGAGVCGSIVSNCVLISNVSASNGGGAYQGTLYDCGLTNNFGYWGGGGVMNATLYHCTLTGNKAPGGPGGGIKGGFLYDCTLTGNSANGGGGGAEGSTLYNCTVISNKATSSGGGGASASTLYNCSLIGNDGTLGGGVSSSTCYNSLLSRNTSGGYDGVGGGGALKSVLYNCTVVSNSTSAAGGGVFGGAAINSIIYHNSATQKDANWSFSNTLPAAFTNSCTTPAQEGWAAGNITEDPRWVDRAVGNYHLRGSSPCVNAGVAFSWMTIPANVHSRDLDGEPRLFGVAVDMGVYEYVPGGFLISVR